MAEGCRFSKDRTEKCVCYAPILSYKKKGWKKWQGKHSHLCQIFHHNPRTERLVTSFGKNGLPIFPPICQCFPLLLQIFPNKPPDFSNPLTKFSMSLFSKGYSQAVSRVPKRNNRILLLQTLCLLHLLCRNLIVKYSGTDSDG